MWTASLFKATGYGQFMLGGRPKLAHRVSYSMNVADIPDDLVLDHRCRNRWCVRPDHLEPVEQRENLLRGHHSTNDKVIRDYFRCGHEKTPENTTTWWPRRCRPCYLKWNRAHPRGARNRAPATPDVEVGT